MAAPSGMFVETTTAVSAQVPVKSQRSRERLSMESLPPPPTALSSSGLDAALLEAPPLAEEEWDCFARVFEGIEVARTAALSERQLQLLLILEKDMIFHPETASGLLPHLQGLGLPPLQGGAALLGSAEGSSEVQARGDSLCKILCARAQALRAALRDIGASKKRSARSRLQLLSGRRSAKGGRFPEVAEDIVAAVDETRERLQRHLVWLQTAAAVLQHARGCAMLCTAAECNSCLGSISVAPEVCALHPLCLYLWFALHVLPA
jgi:hypothetical protein